MAYNFSLGSNKFDMNFGNMFAAKNDNEDKLLGEIAAQPEEPAGGATGSVDPVATQPMSDTNPLSENYFDSSVGFENVDTGGTSTGIAPNPTYNEPGGAAVPGVTGEVAPGELDRGLSGTGIVDPGVPDPSSTGGFSPGMQRQPLYYEDTYIDPLVSNIRGRTQGEHDQLLQDIAMGRAMSPVVEQQRERAQQAALATAASARGMPVSAVQRMLTSQMSEADRIAMETAAAQQVETSGMLAQLEAQRDQQVAALIGMGVDRDKAILDANTRLELQKKDLAQKVFANRLGAMTEVLKAGMEHAHFAESGAENVAEEAAIMNLIMSAPGPAGIDAPTQRILTGQQTDPEAQFFVQTMLPDGSQGQGSMKWNPETGTYEMTSEAGTVGGYENLGIQDMFGQPVTVYRKWNSDDNRYEYAFQPAAGPDLTQTLTGEGQGGMPGAPPGMSQEQYEQWWEDNVDQGGAASGGWNPEAAGDLVYALNPQTGQYEWMQRSVYNQTMNLGDPPKEYGDPGKKEYGDSLDASRYLSGINPTGNQMKLNMGAPNQMFQKTSTPTLLGAQGPSQLQLDMPRFNLPTDPFKAPRGNLKLGQLNKGMKPFHRAAVKSGAFNPEPSSLDWNKYGKVASSIGKELMDFGFQGSKLLTAKGGKEQRAMLGSLGMSALGKGLGYGFQSLDDYLNAPSSKTIAKESAQTGIDELSKSAEPGISQTLASQSGKLAEETSKILSGTAGDAVKTAAGSVAATAGAGEAVVGAAGQAVEEAIGSAAAESASAAGSGIADSVAGPVVSIASGLGRGMMDPSMGPVSGAIRGAGAAGGAAAGTAAGLATGPAAPFVTPFTTLAGAFLGGKAVDPLAGLTEKDRLTASYNRMENPSNYIPQFEYGDPYKRSMLSSILGKRRK
jgi:hypothetical protein